MNEQNEIIEPTLDIEPGPLMEPVSTLSSLALATATPRSRYWQAQGLADMLQHEFDEAQRSGNKATMRERFYLLANYYSRTLAILRSALHDRREPLAQAALHNLISLHTALHAMYKIAPGTVPSTLALSRDVRSRLTESLIVQMLRDAPRSLDLPSITRHVNDLDLLAEASEQVINRYLTNLISTGHVQTHDGTYTCTLRPYSAINLDQIWLQALLGATLFQSCEQEGFRSVADVAAHKSDFRTLIGTLTGFSDDTAALLIAAAEALVRPRAEIASLQTWQHADLLASTHIRPYQREAYAIFRGYGYQGQVIEAPTGSGKTMIGMMCIQDWLHSLSENQSILVLVPTVNSQQQWVGELCYKPLGLKLSPHQVFTGTPASLETLRKRMGIAPSVIVMTYTSLAQTGSGIGKGGFDQDSIEIFLQGNGIQYVIFDEVHKVVEDMHSVSADITRILLEWVYDGSLKGAIGFSGTASNYRSRFAELGMQLVYIMPAAELIAYGFVAPFTEIGIPFAYSDREQRIRDLLDAYRERLRAYIHLIGVAHLKRWFSDIPLDVRVQHGRSLLRMSVGSKNRDEAIAKRLSSWENGDALTLAELPLVTLVQLSHNWSDEDMVRASVRAEDGDDTKEAVALERFHALLQELEHIRHELRPLIYLADTMRRLNGEGFGTTFDAETLRGLSTASISNALRAERVKDGLATTIVGLFDSLSDWYFRVGEGRVDCIKAIIEAERATRKVHGTIIFDAGTRIRWQNRATAPGYNGVAGVFGQMLGDTRFTPMAVLSSEIYLAYDEAHPLPQHIAQYIRREIMASEQGEALFDLTTQGLGLSTQQLLDVHTAFTDILSQYIETLSEVQAARPDEFSRKVLVPFRKAVRKAKLGKLRDKLLARLSLKHYHVRNCVNTFFDYALIADAFLKAHVGELIQVDGTLQKFYVVKMAQGERKQLMYDLSARIVDADEFPVNLIIVSLWARTGWNVIKPNLLIDATATRDVTAWQQLRGRAMRAMRTWTNECYRLVLLLMGSDLHGAEPLDQAIAVLDEPSKALLLQAHAAFQEAQSPAPMQDERLIATINRGMLADLTFEERMQLATELMLARNKVTHIYELVKAYGSTSQIHYDRAGHRWQRTESIAAKHAHEYAVSPLSGELYQGVEHAPLLYSDDPRKDVPSSLEAYLTDTLRDADPKIVKGWLSTIATEMQEEHQQTQPRIHA